MMMKRLMSVVLTCALLLALLPASALADEEETITSTAPACNDTTYTVRKPGELLWVADQTAAGNHFQGFTVELAADLDMTGCDWSGIGYNLNNYFAGTFDGNGFTIKGLSASWSIDSFTIINAPRHTIGLFGVCIGATVKNLVLEDAAFSITNESGYTNAYSSIDGTSVYGGVVSGYASDSVFQNIIVRRSSVKVHTGAESAVAYCGGLVGYAVLCSFAHCGSEGGTVQGTTASLNNDANAGGIVGEWVNEGTMRQCYNTSAVLGCAEYANACTGGLVGRSTNTGSALSAIRDCYNQGRVQHTSSLMETAYIGGIVGYSSSTVNRCYNSGAVTAVSGGYTAKSYAGGISAGGISTSAVANSAVMCTQLSAETGTYTISGAGSRENNLSYSGLPSGQDSGQYALNIFYGSGLFAEKLSWDFGYIWSAEEAGFPTLQYRDADMEEDIQTVDAAAAEIRIIFSDGDRYDHVTGDIAYTPSPNAATVAWYSSNEAVVSAENGSVTRQEQDYQVRITAVISSGKYSVQKKFVLNVLGTSDSAAVEPEEWGMTVDEARTLVAMLRSCKFQDVSASDQDVLVLIGADTNEQHVVSVLASVISYMEVPEENELIKSKTQNVVDLIKSGQNQEMSALIGDLSDSLVKWDSEGESAQINGKTIAKNLIKIPSALLNIKMDFIDGYDKIKALKEFEIKDSKVETALDYTGKLGKVIDYIYNAAASMEPESRSTSLISCSKIVNLANNAYQAFQIYNAYQTVKQNAVKAYINMYLNNRPYFDSADDEAFQLIMSAHAATSIKTDVENIDEIAESLYQIHRKYSGGLEDAYKITVMCPVDVTVYNGEGEIVGRVVNNAVDHSIANSLRITVGGEENDEKTIYVQDDDVYSIALTGNDSGTMSISVERADDRSIRNYLYEDIALETGRSLTFDISSESVAGEEMPVIHDVEDGVETDVSETVDAQSTRYRLTVYPCLEDADGVLTLSPEGGCSTETYLTAGAALRPVIVVNDGYLFDGFYTDSDCTEAYTGATMPASELTLFAKFSENLTGIVITAQPRSADYFLSDEAEELSVQVENDTGYQYQWYRYTGTKDDAEAIDGATSNHYLPGTESEGTVCYFVRISCRSGAETLVLDSESAVIRVSKREVIASGTCGDALTWTIGLDGILTVSGQGPIGDFSGESAPWSAYASQITAVDVRDGVTAVGENAFTGLSHAAWVSFADSVTDIAGGVLSGCDALTELTIPFVGSSRDASGTKDAVLGHLFGTASAGTAQYYTRSGSSLSGDTYNIPASLTSVTVTDAVQIPFGAFFNCAHLSGITLNEGIETVAEYAFSNCGGLTDIVLPKTAASIGDRALSGCTGLRSITVPFVGATSSENGTTSAVLGHLFGPDSGGTEQYVAQSDTSISTSKFGIPAGLTRVTLTNASILPFGAFSNCENLTEISLNSGIESVGAYAFYNCKGLTQLVIPGSVTGISENALRGCDSLEDLTIPFIGSNRQANKTYDGALGYIFGRAYSSDTEYYIQYPILDGTSVSGYGYVVPKTLTRVTVTDAVLIPFGAFSGLTQVQSVVLNPGIETIEAYAFRGCTGLTDVYYCGSETQWGAVSISGSGNDPLLAAEMHYDYGTGDTPGETYTITYAANGGTGTMESGTAAEGEPFTLPDNGFGAPDGKQFRAWSVGGAEYQPGETCVFTENTTVTAMWSDILETPAAVFTATGPDTGTLANVSPDMQYSIDGGGWTDCGSESIALTGLSACTILVVRRGDGMSTVDSEVQRIAVTRAETPRLTVTQPGAAGEKGVIATDASHEYSTDGISWTGCSGALEAEPGTYYVRVRASGTQLASGAQTVVIDQLPYSVSASGEDGRLDYLIHAPQSEQVTVAVAWYASSGRMLGGSVGTVDLVKGENRASLALPAEAAACKLFLLEYGTYKPLCSAWSSR